MNTNKIVLLSAAGDFTDSFVSKLKRDDYAVTQSSSIDQALSRLSSPDVVMFLVDYMVIKTA